MNITIPTRVREEMKSVPKQESVKSTVTAPDRKGGINGAPKSRNAKEHNKRILIVKINLGYS